MLHLSPSPSPSPPAFCPCFLIHMLAGSGGPGVTADLDAQYACVGSLADRLVLTKKQGRKADIDSCVRCSSNLLALDRAGRLAQTQRPGRVVGSPLPATRL